MPGSVSKFGSWLACCLGQGSRALIGHADLASLIAEVGEDRHKAGSLVFREGEATAKVHVIREDSVELSRMLSGRRVTVQLLIPGDVFGDVPLFLGEPQPFDAIAVTDSAVLSMDAATLFRLLSTRPALMRRWMVSLAGRMSGLQQRLAVLLAGDLEDQVAAALLQHVDTRQRVATTQAQLANLLGLQRTSVQRVLKPLADAELIKVGYRRVEILDAAGLVSLVTPDE